jgi:hypothetical protein
MPTTSVTLRFPDELLVLIDADAKRRGLKRTAAIVNGMWAVVSGGGSSVVEQRPPVRDSAGSIPAPRSKLKIAGLDVQTDATMPPNRVELRRPQPKVTQCPTCFSLNGMHQKWCKAKG